jgi:oligopeptide/dipeptide ABC transporter ATP-binding protein
MYAGRLVESGSRMDILRDAAHPYTQGLLRSMPALAQPGDPLPEIPGVVPSPEAWTEGCRFSNRCTRVLERCPDELPPLATVCEKHECWCHAVAQEQGS